MKRLKLTYALFLLLGMFATYIVISVIVTTDLSYKDIGPENFYIFGVSILLAVIGLLLAHESMVRSQKNENNNLHLYIGGYIPSKKLNNLIISHVLRKGDSITRKTDFVSDWKYTKQLINFLDSCDFAEDIPRQKITCKVTLGDKEFIATSATKEMALCIAFLKSCESEL